MGGEEVMVGRKWIGRSHFTLMQSDDAYPEAA